MCHRSWETTARHGRRTPAEISEPSCWRKNRPQTEFVRHDLPSHLSVTTYNVCVYLDAGPGTHHHFSHDHDALKAVQCLLLCTQNFTLPLTSYTLKRGIFCNIEIVKRFSSEFSNNNFVNKCNSNYLLRATVGLIAVIVIGRPDCDLPDGR